MKAKINRTNFPVWTGLRHSVPHFLKSRKSPPMLNTPSFTIDGNLFNVMEKKSKSYYLMITSKKAQLPNASSKRQREFASFSDCLPKIFALPFKLALVPYVRTFQYKVLNSILYTNDKLYIIGFSQSNKCTFCKSDLESLYHLLYICPLSRNFWADFEIFWSSISKEEIHLSLQDVILGITTRPCPLLNYLLLIAKIYLWD